MSSQVYPGTVRGWTYSVLKSPEFSTIVQKAASGYETRIAQYVNPRWHFELIYDYLWDDPNNLVSGASYTDLRTLMGFYLQRGGQFDDFLFNDPTDDTFGMQPLISGLSAAPGVFRFATNYPVGAYIVDNNSTPHLQQVTSGGISGTSVPVFSIVGGSVTSGGATFTDAGVFSGANAQAVALVTDGTFYYSPVQRNFGGMLEDVTDLDTTIYALKVWANGVLQAVTTNYTINTGGLAIPGFSYAGDYLKWVGTPTGPITILGKFYFRTRFDMDKIDFENFVNLLWTVGGGSSSKGSGSVNLITSRPVSA